MSEILDVDCPGLEEVLAISDGNLNKASHLLDIRLEATDQMIKRLSYNIDNLSEDEFYDRLMKLKSDHKKTLNLCEQLYLLQASHDPSNDHHDCEVLERYAKFQATDVENREFVQLSIKNLKDKLTSIIEHDEADLRRPSKSQSRSSSCFPIEMEANPDELVDYSIRRTVQEKVKELWQFNKEREEAEKVKKENIQTILKQQSSRNSVAFSGQLEMSKRSNSEEDMSSHWRHRITIPQPFSMTIRDELACGKHKSRTMIQFENEIREKKRHEDEILKKRFKAKPIPAHVYIPLFDGMMEEQQTRRQIVKQRRKEILEASEKPFHFYIRDKIKESRNQQKPLGSEHGERIAKIPRARPVPKSVKEARLERMMEDELLREVNVKMRAQKLYKSAHAPPGLEKRQNEMEQRLKEKMDELSNNSNAEVKTLKARKVPDFKKIHQKRSQGSWSTCEPTKPQPFNLHTETRIRSRPSSAGPTLSSRSSMKSSASTTEWNKSIIAAMEAPLPPTNKSAALRESMTKERLNAREKNEREAMEEERIKKRRQYGLATELRQKLDIEEPQKVIDENVKQKLSELKSQDAAYRNYLSEIDEKVRNRELLVEKQAIKSAKLKADREYLEGLRKHNLEFNELERQSKAPNHFDSNDDFQPLMTSDKTDYAMNFLEEMA